MNRYDRQERVHQIGVVGQQKISHATIMIVGVGALGSYTAEQLVRAGVKRLVLIDPDTVDVTNNGLRSKQLKNIYIKLIQHVKLLQSQRQLLLILLTNISLPFV